MEHIINQNDITNKCGKRIVMISSYCDTEEKINVLRNNIETIKSHNLDVAHSLKIRANLTLHSNYFIFEEIVLKKWTLIKFTL